MSDEDPTLISIYVIFPPCNISGPTNLTSLNEFCNEERVTCFFTSLVLAFQDLTAGHSVVKNMVHVLNFVATTVVAADLVWLKTVVMENQEVMGTTCALKVSRDMPITEF